MLVLDQPRCTRVALESLADTTRGHELVVVDNGSRDREAQGLVERWARSLVRNEENLGVPRGWNQGLAAARGEVVAIANNDITFVEGWAESLCEVAADPAVGLVVPASPDGGKVQVPAAGAGVVRLPRFGKTPHGLLMVARRAVWEAVGGFCEEYGLASNEDKDLCYTVWDRGWEVAVDHRVVIPHEGGATWRTVLGERRARRLWRANRRTFERRWGARRRERGGAPGDVVPEETV